MKNGEKKEENTNPSLSWHGQPSRHDRRHAPCRQHQVNKSEKQVNNRLMGRPSPL